MFVWLVAGADLFWDKSVDLFWDKSTFGW
jgi:hypothetical protein